MNRRVLWSVIGVVALLVVALGALLFLRAYERTTTVETLPPQGEATYNPLYVLGQALRADGLQVHSRATLDLRAMAPAARDTIVLLQDSDNLTPAQVTGLLDWVGSGGHLLVRTPPLGDDATRHEPALLQQLGVQSIGFANRCEQFNVADDPGHTEFCSGRRFDLDPSARDAAELRWGERGHVFARLRHGKGRVDVLADMDYMKTRGGDANTLQRAFESAHDRNMPPDGLRDRAHRDLTRYLLDPNYGHGTVWLVYGSRPMSLWATLLLQGWPVWVPLLLALLCWLAAHAQRFGSELPAPRDERRSLLQHIRASGELLLRQRQGPALHAAVRALLLRRLQRRAPVAAALDGAARDQAIAELIGWPAARIATAFAAPPDNDPSALRERISLLLQMRRLL